MNNGIFVQSLLDKTSPDLGLPKTASSLNPVPQIYGYGGDEYWRIDNTKFVIIVDTRYGTNTTITLPTGSGPAYNILVDWGDGNINRYTGTTTNISYSYQNHGIYIIQISGTLTAWGANFVNSNANKVIKCLSFGNFPFTAIYYAFDANSNLVEVPYILPTGATQLQFCFRNCTKFNQNLENFNLNSATSLVGMFSGCSSLKHGLSNVSVTNNTSCQEMFQGCRGLSNENFNNWTFNGNNNAQSMFFDCRSFLGYGLETWNTSGITNMTAMLNLCIVNTNISSWNTSNVTTMTSMFSDNSAFNQPIGTWDVSKVTLMNSMFRNATAFNQDIGAWNVGLVTNFSDMFSGRFFNNGGSNSINNWNTSSGTNMTTMFQNNAAFNQPINNWNVSKVTNMSSMFNNATAFNQSLSSWNLAGLNANTSLDNFMFGKTGAGVYSTANYDALLIGWNNNKLLAANGVANWRTDLRPNFGGAKYTAGGAAATARAALVSYGWTITDGGTA